MSTITPPEIHEPRRGREARRSARAQRGVASIPYITRAIPLTEMLSEEGLAIIERNADTLLQEVGIEFRDYPSALDLFRQAGCDVKGHRVRFPSGLARQLCATTPAQYVQHARNPERNVVIGGKEHRLRPQLRLALRARSRQGPALRDDRGFPQFREARLSLAVHPSFRRHRLRAGRSARQQAAFRDGLRAYEVLGQAVHGVGDQAGTRRGYGEDVRNPVRRGFRRRQYGLHQPDQRQLAARLGLDHARRGRSLCARQPGLHHHAVYSLGRDEPGQRRGNLDAGARRGDGGDGVLPTRSSRRAGGVRHVRLHAVDAIGGADLRHARSGARHLRRGATGAAHEYALPHRRLALRLEDSRRAGRIRERANLDPDDAGGHEFRAPRRRLARRAACLRATRNS